MTTIKSAIIAITLLPCCLFARDKAKEEHKCEKFLYNYHEYICFDNKFFMHSPDCGCHITKVYEGRIFHTSLEADEIIMWQVPDLD